MSGLFLVKDDEVQAVIGKKKTASMKTIRRADAVIDIYSDPCVERPTPTAAPSAFRIWGSGDNPTDHGMTVFSDRSAECLMAEQAARGNLFSMDVDHLSLSKVAPPESRRAVGWHRLEVRKDANGSAELWACHLEWTDLARRGLEANPPEWRYFSPAYETDPETGEVVSYINTSLTNNPATWNVTALATRTTDDEEQADMKYAEVMAALAKRAEADTKAKRMADALKKMADDDDTDADTIAAAIVSAMSDEDEAAPPPHAEPDGDEPSSGEGPKAGPPKTEDDDAKKADAAVTAKVAATRSADPAIDVVAELLEMKREFGELKVREERARLLASRPDLSRIPSMKTWLDVAPIETVRQACTRFPKTAAPAVASKAAASEVKATRGATQVDPDGRAPRLPKDDADWMAEKMGMRRRTDSVRRVGNDLVFGVVTPEAAKENLEKLMSANGAGKGGV